VLVGGVHSINLEHKHSGLKFVTPAQRRNGVAAAAVLRNVKPFMQRQGAQSTALVPIDGQAMTGAT
jgi:hypothetical protein